MLHEIAHDKFTIDTDTPLVSVRSSVSPMPSIYSKSENPKTSNLVEIQSLTQWRKFEFKK